MRSINKQKTKRETKEPLMQCRCRNSRRRERRKRKGVRLTKKCVMCQAATNEAFTLDEKDSDKKSKKVSERE